MKAGFFIRDKKGDRVTLYVSVQRKNPRISWVVSTGKEVTRTKWQKAYGTKGWMDYISTVEGADVYARMTAIQSIVDKLMTEGHLGSNDDKHYFVEALNDEKAKEANETAAEAERIRQEAEAKRDRTITKFCAKHIDLMERHIVQNKYNTDYAPGTIGVWKRFLRQLKDYDESAMFDDVTKLWVGGFREFMKEKGLMGHTINSMIEIGRALTTAAMDEGICTNLRVPGAWEKVGINKKGKNTKTQIYLNDDEINALWEMDLTGRERDARDLFFLGILTAQRYSDYSRFKPSDFVLNKDDGKYYVTFTQQKTNNEMTVYVPDSEKIKELKRRYLAFPKFASLQNFDYALRKIFKMLAKSVPSLNVMVETEQTTRELAMEKRNPSSFIHSSEHPDKILKPRWAMLASHSARRTAICSLIERGVSESDVKMLSGHKTQEAFSTYVLLTPAKQMQQTAKRIEKALGEAMKAAN